MLKNVHKSTVLIGNHAKVIKIIIKRGTPPDSARGAIKLAMKTVLYIAPSLSVKGGISTVIKDYLGTDLPKRYKIILVSSHRDGPKTLKLITAITGLAQTFFFFVFKKIDIVHIHGSAQTSLKRKFIYYKVACLFARKIIFHFHGGLLMESYPALSDRWKTCIKDFFECSNRVICLSESWKHDVLSIAPTARISVIPNSITLPVLYARSKQENSALQITFLGHIFERKGIFDLLKVTRRLIDSGFNIRLSIGGYGDLGRMTTEIANLGIGDRVEYLGWVSPRKRDALLRKTDIFVLPSYVEGMPMTILEAMSYAIPVISTWVGGIPELVVHGETGFLVKPGDMETLRDRIMELAADDEKRRVFGLNGRGIIEQKHDIGKNIKLIDDIYRTL